MVMNNVGIKFLELIGDILDESLILAENPFSFFTSIFKVKTFNLERWFFFNLSN